MTILRPETRLLDENHKENIYEEAKQIIETLGIFVENSEARALLDAEGVNHDGDRYFFPSDLVEKCMQSVPREIVLYDREGDKSAVLAGNEVNFDPGSAAIFILDENTGDIRDPVMDDFKRFSRVVDHLKHIEVQSTALVYQDVPKKAQDWHRLYTALTNCSKPVVTGTFLKESFAIMKEMLVACRTSEKKLAEKPLAIFDACPSPPLKWSDLTTQSLIDAARAMIPSEFVSMPLAGASAPVTLIGSITQHCAECLAGVVIVQLAKRGAPLIWGGSPAILDMKNGTTPMGAMGTMMIDLGDIEMGKHFGLPTHAYMSLSDSKLLDTQAGLEAGMGAILAGLGGCNMVSGPGMIDFESTQSIQKLIIDNEIAGMVKHFLKGISDHGQPYAMDILKDYSKKEELLSHPTTLKYFRKEFYMPGKVINRSTRETWKNEGSKSAEKQAKEIAAVLANKPSKKPISGDLLKELDNIVTANL
ncbi:MAG: trimethylamine methyltransferase family protein [Candidatus Hodarchaeales archaeon]